MLFRSGLLANQFNMIGSGMTVTQERNLKVNFSDSFIIVGQTVLLHPRLAGKVGSIEDNRLGGWYSYRASKAALNMLLKTAAIEVQRAQPNAVLVALHPGTVDSALSAPFRGAEIGRPAAAAAADLLRVIDGLNPEHTASFFSYTGERLPW